MLIRIVDVLIVDHLMRHAFLALVLQAYVVPQLLKGPAWRPPHSVAVAAFLWTGCLSSTSRSAWSRLLKGAT